MPMHAPPHPGKNILINIEALELPISKAAEALGVTRQQLYRVVRGQCGISPEMALRLEAVIGSTAEHWMRLQTAYDIARIRNSEANPAANLSRLDVA